MPFTLTGAQVRSLRLALGVTQADLAHALGYARQTISRWERHPERAIPPTQWLPLLRFLVARRRLLRELVADAALASLDNPAKSGVRRRQ